MPRKRYTPEEIVAKSRQVDVLVSQGQNIADAKATDWSQIVAHERMVTHTAIGRPSR